jgi:hypothetical protein
MDDLLKANRLLCHLEQWDGKRIKDIWHPENADHQIDLAHPANIGACVSRPGMSL